MPPWRWQTAEARCCQRHHTQGAHQGTGSITEGAKLIILIFFLFQLYYYFIIFFRSTIWFVFTARIYSFETFPRNFMLFIMYSLGRNFINFKFMHHAAHLGKKLTSLSPASDAFARIISTIEVDRNVRTRHTSRFASLPKYLASVNPEIRCLSSLLTQSASLYIYSVV